MACLLAWGAGLRYQTSYPHFLETHNVASYYYAKSEALESAGSFPVVDARDRAGAPYAENAPPGLAYATAGLFGFIRPFAPQLDFISFARMFPILVYLLWAVSGFFIFFHLTRRIASGAAFAFLLTFIPAAVELTRYGHYLEELTGVWFMFVALWCLLNLERSWRWVIGGGVALTLLALTWQQFPVFYAGALGAVAIEALFRPRLWRMFAVRALSMLALPILIGEAVRYLSGTGYSPLVILNELRIAVVNRYAPDLLLVMRRNDWNGLALTNFPKSFGLFGTILIAVGLLSALARSTAERRSRILAVFGAIGVALPILFLKERFLALGVLAYPAVIGFEAILEPARLLAPFRRRVSLRGLSAPVRRFAGPALLVAAFAAALATAWHPKGYRTAPPPAPRLAVSGIPEQWEVGKTYPLAVRLENTGHDALDERSAFGGLHVEVTNAKIGALSAHSPFTAADLTVKPYAQWGNAFFFETKYRHLKRDEYGSVNFEVTPTWPPVKLYVRGWLPGPCPAPERAAVLKDLLPGWQDASSGWRSEQCLKRVPENDDASAPYCLTTVFAARQAPIPYRCLVK